VRSTRASAAQARAVTPEAQYPVPGLSAGVPRQSTVAGGSALPPLFWGVTGWSIRGSRIIAGGDGCSSR